MAPPKKKPSRQSSLSRRSTSARKTEILINVYDLLPPGKLSSALWFLGSSLLHTGVHIPSLSHEYAFGGHSQPSTSGVYWTRPHLEPPGGTFRCEILQGFTFRPALEIEAIIKEVSQRFHGTSYNLLSNNCNHFTSYLCEQLTSRPAPSWLNRAASIGVALPCVVPREWISPPDHDTADGELLEEDEDDERSAMLRQEQRRSHSFHGAGGDDGQEHWEERDAGTPGSVGSGNGRASVRDTAGRKLPTSERAPAP